MSGAVAAVMAAQKIGAGGGGSLVHAFTANSVASEGTLVAGVWNHTELASDDDTVHDDPLRVRFGPTPKYRPLYRETVFPTTLAGRTVTAVKVRLYKKSANDLTFELHRILRAWTIAGGRWSEYAAGVAWGTAGAANATDVSTTLSATFTATSTADGYIVFTSAQLVTDVQAMIAGSNNGWVLDATTDSGGMGFGRDWDTDGQRPELIVTSTA